MLNFSHCAGLLQVKQTKRRMKTKEMPSALNRIVQISRVSYSLAPLEDKTYIMSGRYKERVARVTSAVKSALRNMKNVHNLNLEREIFKYADGTVKERKKDIR